MIPVLIQRRCPQSRRKLVISKGQAISLAMHYYQLDFSVKRGTYKAIKASRYDALFVLVNAAAIAITVVLRIFFYIPV